MRSPPRLFYSAGYSVELGAHVFPMQKYRLTRRLLLELGRAVESDFEQPAPARDAEVLAVHTADYVERLQSLRLTSDEVRVLELEPDAALVRAAWLMAGGTIAACRRALELGFAANLGGGFHHAFADHGEGFCVLNDVVIGARAMLDEERVRRVAVLDVDVHQGNGTAALCRDEARVFTCSLHQQQLYPFAKPASDLDLGLPDGTAGALYLETLGRALAATLASRPELLIYVAGADPYAGDQLGGLALSIDDLRARDRLVLEGCAAHGLPVAVLLAGGYAAEVFDTVSIHAATIAIGLGLTPPAAGDGPAARPPGTVR